MAIDILCCLLTTFANSLDPDQNRQNISPETPIVDQNHLSADNLCKQFGCLDPHKNRQNIGPETPDVGQNHLSADNLCKQLRSRSEPTEHKP